MFRRVFGEARFRVPASGGRPTDPAWTERRLLPLAPRTLKKLEEITAKVREHGVNVEPMQLAALLVEKTAEQLSERGAEDLGPPDAENEPLTTSSWTPGTAGSAGSAGGERDSYLRFSGGGRQRCHEASRSPRDMGRSRASRGRARWPARRRFDSRFGAKMADGTVAKKNLSAVSLLWSGKGDLNFVNRER